MTRKTFLSALFAPLVAWFFPKPTIPRPRLMHAKLPQFIQDTINAQRGDIFTIQVTNAINPLRKCMSTYDASLGGTSESGRSINARRS